MEVAVLEEPQKKIFRARKTMKMSDRQQLEVLHNTLVTAHPNSSSQPQTPLVNGTHGEDGQKGKEKDQETGTKSPASPSSRSSPVPSRSLSLSRSPSPAENRNPSPSLKKGSEKGKGEEKKGEKDRKDDKKAEEVKADKTETTKSARTGSPSVSDKKTEQKKTPSDQVLNGELPMDADSTSLDNGSAEEKSSKSISSSSPSGSPAASLECDPEVKEGFLCLSEEDEGQGEQDEAKDRNEEKMDVDPEKEEKKEGEKGCNVADGTGTSTPSGKKRSLSPVEGKDGWKDGEIKEDRDGKRARVEGVQLEAQLELKITANAGSRLKLEKVVQQLVEERLRVLQLTVFDHSLQELKDRMEKIDAATKQQKTVQHTLQSKIARLTKKFGAANQASENSKKAQEAAAVTAAKPTPTPMTTPTTQRTVRTTLDPKLSNPSASSSSSDSGESDPDFAGPSSSSPASTEGEEDSEDPGSKWIGRNGEVWFSTNVETAPFSEPTSDMTPGPTLYAIAKVQDVASTFNLFFTEEMIDLIVSMTNLHGRRTVKNWTGVDSTDLHAYMGLLILAGIYRSRGESTRCLWDDRSGRAIFRATMSPSRFYELSRALRFDDKLQRPAGHGEDKLFPIRSLWEMWTERLPLLFNPGKDVTVDEQFVPFKGRCSFRQYMPKKTAKYGLKFWVTADVATSYAWKCDVYLGKTSGPGQAEVDQGKRVVMEMTEGLQGVTVTCDNHFTSYSLAQELLQKEVALVGMIRKNKPELPPNLVRVKGRPALSAVFAFTKNTTAVSYITKRGRNVTLISTRHRKAAVTEGPKKKPEMITDYTRCKGGVNNLEKVIGTYTCRMKTNRWPQMMLFNMVDITAYNAYVIHTAVDPSWNQAKVFRRRLFLEELGNSLVSAAILRREHLPRAPVAAALVRGIQFSAAVPPDTKPLTPADTSSSGVKRGTCQWCKGQKKRTVSTCSCCGGHTCKEHQRICCLSCWKN
ncbi:activating transcription factor 7-interacting protein 1 isoform X4 [Hemibagrus wyckioides]|uniref:activating transcription factor 7-interacting protein 1 isoform X4 n=1 Tax=Hemibagrus wyckioides TaxID=337641 RepID=UPI00266BCCAA|nr:activating transcription factor 7-interacting protein 1 isoform X4 [Hemibagrus wyckioides]